MALFRLVPGWRRQEVQHCANAFATLPLSWVLSPTSGCLFWRGYLKVCRSLAINGHSCFEWTVTRWFSNRSNMISYAPIFARVNKFESNIIPIIKYVTDIKLSDLCRVLARLSSFDKLSVLTLSRFSVARRMGHKQRRCFSFCIHYIASTVLFKEADSQTLKRSCANWQKLLREANNVEPEKANGPKLGQHCEMAYDGIGWFTL